MVEELRISEETLMRRFGGSRNKLAAVARRAVDWVEKHGDAETLARAVMVMVREDVVMRALFGEEGVSPRSPARRTQKTD